MLRWHSSNAFTLACSCFSFFPPPTTGLLPCIKMNTSSEATKVDLILDWTLICGVDTMSRKNIFIPMSASIPIYFLSHPFSLRKKKRKKKRRKHLWIRNDTFGIRSKKVLSSSTKVLN